MKFNVLLRLVVISETLWLSPVHSLRQTCFRDQSQIQYENNFLPTGKTPKYQNFVPFLVFAGTTTSFLTLKRRLPKREANKSAKIAVQPHILRYTFLLVVSIGK